MRHEGADGTSSGQRSYPARSAYVGDQATHYEEARQANRALLRKWRAEEAALSALLDLLPGGSSILDMPAGTGRFIPALESRSLTWHAGDISHEMLLKVIEKVDPARDCSLRRVVCEAESLPFRSRSVDFVLSMRFFNLIPFSVARDVLVEYARVARLGVILEVRFRGDRRRDVLARYARMAICRLLRRNSGDDSAQILFSSKTHYPLPTSSEFVSLIHAAGFRIRHALRIRDTWHPLRPDPLMLLLLSLE